MGRAWLLGRMAFQRDDGTYVEVRAMPTVKVMDLLLLLAGGQGWKCADHYIAQLWPEADVEHGRGSLRTAVAHLRKMLGTEGVRRSGDLISLGEIRTDIDELRDLARAGAAARRAGQDPEVAALARTARESYADDLVVSGGSCDAVYRLRDELRELRRHLLLDGAAACARLGWMRESLELARAADTVATTEESALAMMLAYSGLGETALVIETFERLRRDLDEAYGVQPSSRSRALYLQVVTAGEQEQLEPPVFHLDLADEVASAIVRLASGPAPGGVVWLYGEPGSGRGSIGRRARRLSEEAGVGETALVELCPEMVAVDADEAERIRCEASTTRRVLVVPVRSPVVVPEGARDVTVPVPRLDCEEFRALLRRLLQGDPAPRLEARIWAASGGLAGRTCRTVRRMLRSWELAWSPGGLDFAARQPAGRPQAVSVRVRAVLMPALMQMSSWLGAAEGALGPAVIAA